MAAAAVGATAFVTAAKHEEAGAERARAPREAEVPASRGAEAAAAVAVVRRSLPDRATPRC